MSNPLLRPDDPQFRRPEIRDANGQNRFSDVEAQPRGTLHDGTRSGDPFAASNVNDGSRPYRAEYLVQQTSRAPLLLFLGGISWGAVAVGLVSFTGWLDAGWVSPLLGIGPSGAAWLLSREELKAISAGAIDNSSRGPARHALWLSGMGLIACLVVVATMVYKQMHALPNV